MSNIFPQPIKNLPKADIPINGLKSYLSQSDTHQIIFMEFKNDVVLPAHSHAAQFGIVLEGRIELIINKKKIIYKKGIAIIFRKVFGIQEKSMRDTLILPFSMSLTAIQKNNDKAWQ